ncbi:hypothetical protein OQA88_9310 [Cercophora sp. LCS_1]
MWFPQALALAASACLVAANHGNPRPRETSFPRSRLNVAPDSESGANSPSLHQARKPICQVGGPRPFLRPFFSSKKLVDNNFSGCWTLCEAEPKCWSFSIEIKTGGLCSLYNRPVSPLQEYYDYFRGGNDSVLLFDYNCPAPVIQGPKLKPYKPTSTTPVPTGAGPAVTFQPYTAPSIAPLDSPPYVPTGPQSKPDDDDEFTATYTYTEFPLTIAQMGNPTLTTGVPLPSGTELPKLPCMVTPGAQSPFTILNENFLPMVSRTNSIGPLLQPTAAPAANDPILDPVNYKAPSFYLKPVAGNTEVFDLVYASTGQFVAVTSSGRVILVSSSTGPTVSNGRITSLFSIDCRGGVTIKFNGTSYIWSTDGETSTIVKGTPSGFNMKALPVVPPEIHPLLQSREETEKLTAKLLARAKLRNPSLSLTVRRPGVNADSRAPQCKAQPPGLVSKTKAGFKLGEGNFCDALDDWWGVSPFSFDGSCAVQSLCYDQCSGFSFTGCNAIFGTQMYLSCLSEFDSWWEVAAAIACAGQATYFTVAASNDVGRKLYYKAQEAMCFCFCSSPPDTCLFQSGDFYCADTRGSDDNNCGGCGTMCGANSKCRSGKCGCPRDQCGSTCLDLRNNPNNCGKCGAACDPKFCIDGSCYVPKPDECTPEQAVFNNKFADLSPGFTNWTFAAYPGSTIPDDITFGASTYTFGTGPNDKTRAVSISMKNLPSGGRAAVITQKGVKICPGFRYELTFDLGYVNQVDTVGVVSDADCKVRWLTGPPSGPDTNGSFQSSDSYSVGKSNPVYRTFGPWSVVIKEGDAGVTKKKKSLFIDLSAVVSCFGGTNARVIMTNVQMNPVGFAKRELDAGSFWNVTVAGPRVVQARGGISEALDIVVPEEGDDALVQARVIQGRDNWLIGGL